MDIKKYMNELGQQARTASRELNRANTGQKNTALLAIADAIEADSAALLAANKKDMDAGEKNGLDEALLDRLALNDERIKGMAEGIRQIVALPDPVGELQI